MKKFSESNIHEIHRNTMPIVYTFQNQNNQLLTTVFASSKPAVAKTEIQIMRKVSGARRINMHGMRVIE